MNTPAGRQRYTLNLATLVHLVLAALLAILLQLELLAALGVQGGHVITLFAFQTFKDDRFAHVRYSCFWFQRPVLVPGC